MDFCAPQINVDSATWLLYRWLMKSCFPIKPCISTELWALYELREHFGLLVICFMLS